MIFGKGGFNVIDLDGLHFETFSIAEDSKTVFPGIYKQMVSALKNGKPIMVYNISITTTSEDDPPVTSPVARGGAVVFPYYSAELPNTVCFSLYGTDIYVLSDDSISDNP